MVRVSTIRSNAKPFRHSLPPARPKAYKHRHRIRKTHHSTARSVYRDTGKSKLGIQDSVRLQTQKQTHLSTYHKTSQQHSNLTEFQKNIEKPQIAKTTPKSRKASHLRNLNHQFSGEETSHNVRHRQIHQPPHAKMLLQHHNPPLLHRHYRTTHKKSSL
jgi:hypothetical protein